jgi:hypothetical protein
MTPIARAAAVALIALSASACGPFQVYRLPVSAARAPETFAPIASVASNRGLQYAEFPNAVNVRLDQGTWVYFRVQNEAYNMSIQLDGNLVPEPERPAKFQWAKAQADDIWQAAMAAMRDTAPVYAPPAYAPPAVPAPPGVDIHINMQ